jgi:hypothetical protein
MRLFRLEVLGVVFPPGSTPDMIRVGWEQAREWAGWGRFTFYPCFHNIIAHFPLKEESRGKIPLVSCHSNSFPLKG